MDLEASYCILVSDRPADEEFAREICASIGVKLFRVSDIREARKMLIPGIVVFWDLDAENPPQIPLGQLLLEQVGAGLIFGLGDKPLNEYAHALKMRAIGHYFRRGFPSGVEWASRIVAACLAGIAPSLPASEPPQIRKLSIAQAKDRSLAAEAVSNVFTQKSLPPRLAQTLAQCVDELLMNAIFDAPVLQGNRYFLERDRTLDFELKEKEVVTLEMITMDDFILIGVSDQFGSLARGTILSHLAKDYERVDYYPHAGVGAGLGIYGIVDAGISLSYYIRKGHLTQATLIVPARASMKEFRKVFQLFSVIERA